MININKIYNEDCVDFIKKLPSNIINLAILDPPYFRILKNENWDKFKNILEYMQWSEIYIKLIVQKLAYNGTLILYGCTRNFNIVCRLNNLLENNGMEFIQEIVIDKGMKSVAGRTNSNIKMLPCVSENIMVYRKNAKPFIKKLLKDKQLEYKKTCKEMNELLNCKSNGGGNWTKYTGNTEFPLFPTEKHWNILKNVFDLNIEYEEIKIHYNPIMGLTNVWNDIDFYIKNRKHPSQKPVELGERIINMFSDERNLVYIPFAGSGSEIKACINTCRNFIATENNKLYIDNIFKSEFKDYLVT